jgi:hypothetical protein
MYKLGAWAEESGPAPVALPLAFSPCRPPQNAEVNDRQIGTRVTIEI